MAPLILLIPGLGLALWLAKQVPVPVDLRLMLPQEYAGASDVAANLWRDEALEARLTLQRRCDGERCEPWPGGGARKLQWSLELPSGDYTLRLGTHCYPFALTSFKGSQQLTLPEAKRCSEAGVP